MLRLDIQLRPKSSSPMGLSVKVKYLIFLIAETHSEGLQTQHEILTGIRGKEKYCSSKGSSVKCSWALVLFRVRNDGDCWRPLARLALTTMPGEPSAQQLQKEERQEVIFSVGASFK